MPSGGGWMDIPYRKVDSKDAGTGGSRKCEGVE